jgi:hypothetical protein
METFLPLPPQYANGGIIPVRGPSDVELVAREVQAIQNAKRDKRIKRLTRMHMNAWYAKQHHCDVMEITIDGFIRLAICQRGDGLEPSWTMTGRAGSMGLADLIGFLVGNDIYPDQVNQL